ncbi:MAG: DUF835 domain-containing protein, partial [Candidatus Thermoplasmatota archaeon]|nr:DUF835 domain-containing protein [Candidatus Thermoplasmatota archaeon]
KYELRPRYSYLVEEEKATKSFEIFADQVTHGIEGLCISRKHPELIKERYGLDKVPKIWLTAEIADDSLKPTDLALLTLTIRDFIDKTENGVVLLDGIDYLLLNNSFESVVKTLNSINDSIMRSKSRLILSINPAEFSAKQFALLSKNLEKIET